MKISLVIIIFFLCCFAGFKSNAQTCSQPVIDSRCIPPNTFNFVSQQNGNWSDGSTWVGGVAPPIENINNRQIRISHDVIVQNGSLKLDNNSVIYIDQTGRLTLRNGNLHLEDGNQTTTEKLIIVGGSLRTSGNVQQSGTSTVFCATAAELEIGDEHAGSTLSAFTAGLFNLSGSSTSADFQNTQGYRRLENVCLNVTHNMQNDGGTDELIGVCAEIGDQGPFSGPKNNNGGNGSFDSNDSGNFQVQSSTGTSTKIYNSEFYIPNGNFQNNRSMIICNSDFRLTNGNFQNQSSSSITGQEIVIWINNSGSGNIENSGTWAASTILAWRTDNSNNPTGLSGLVAESSAANILTQFNDCECDLDINPLPVELLYFAGQTDKIGPLLTWATASEMNNDRFEIERSSNGRNFESIGQVKGAGTSSSLQKYRFTDLNANFGTYYYRLKQTDSDSHQTIFSKIIILNVAVSSSEIDLIPNPVSQGAPLFLKRTGNSEGNLKLFDINGRKITAIPALKNVRQIKIETQGLKPGVYIIKLEEPLNVSVKKLVIQ